MRTEESAMMRTIFAATIASTVLCGCGDPTYENLIGDCASVTADLSLASSALTLVGTQSACLSLAGNTVAELDQGGWNAGGQLPFDIPIPVPVIIDRPFSALLEVGIQGGGTLRAIVALESPNQPSQTLDALASTSGPADAPNLFETLNPGEAYVFIDNLPAVGGGSVTVGPSVWPTYPDEEGHVELTFDGVVVTGGVLSGTLSVDVVMGGTTLSGG